MEEDFSSAELKNAIFKRKVDFWNNEEFSKVLPGKYYFRLNQRQPTMILISSVQLQLL